MPRAIAASCQASIVTVEGVPVPGAVILSEGISASSGFAIFDEDKVYYVAKTSPDLKAAMTALNSMIQNILTVLSSVDSSATSGSNAAAIASIVVANTQFGLTKDLLK